EAGQQGARLARIVIYPVKSLPGVELEEVAVLPSGALAGDRQFAMVDGQGEIVNGKRFTRMHTIRTRIDPAQRTISAWSEEYPASTSFHWDNDRAAFEKWVSNYFGLPITLVENRERGLPDDPDSPGPTLVSTATLAAVGEWFGFDVAE